MAITTTGKFDSAEYYECRESDELSHGTEDEAIEDWMDMTLGPTSTAAELEQEIRKWGSLEISAYDRDEISDKTLQLWASSAEEYVNEWAWENFGNRDDPDAAVFNPEQLKTAFLEALRKVKPDVWSCSGVGTRTYEGDDLVAKCREVSPHWFKE